MGEPTGRDCPKANDEKVTAAISSINLYDIMRFNIEGIL